VNKLTILVGPPGSGKSSFAATLEAQGYLRISQDEMGKEHLNLFHSHIATGRDIVVDRMGFDKQQRNRYRLEAIKNGYTVNLVEFVVPRQVCYDRCMARENHPTINGLSIFNGEARSGTASSIEEMKQQIELIRQEQNAAKAKSANNALNCYFSRYEEITEDEGELLRIQYNAPEKSDAIMVDIDGTLANLDHRLHYVKDGNRDWGSFFRTVGKDGVYEDVKGIVDLEFLTGTSVVLCSGRTEDQTRENTEKWLVKNEIPYTSLKMRPAGNYKQDAITKAMLYRYEIKPYFNIKYVLDDRDQVVQKWREMGLTCFQVRPGNF